MLKACSRCGKIHDYNYKCNVGKYRKFADTTEARLRSTSAWQHKRASVKERAFYLCEVCKAQGIYNFTDIEIHHIQKIKDNPTAYLDDDNLVALCIPHHKQADAGEIPISYLQELAKKRDEATEPTGETQQGGIHPPAIEG